MVFVVVVFVVVVFLHAHSSGMNVLQSADCVSTKTIKKKMMKEIHVGFRRVLGAWPEVCVSTPYTRVSPVFYFFFRSLIDLVNFRKKMAWVFQTPTQLLYFLTILYIVPHHHHIPTLLTLAFFLVLRMKTAPHDRRRSFGIVTTAQEEDLCSHAQKKNGRRS